MEYQEIARLIERVVSGGSLSKTLWPEAAQLQPEDFGLISSGGNLSFPAAPQTMDEAQIQSALPDLQVTTFTLVDSTNSQMVKRGADASIAGQLYLAEFQYGGRGRRGRRWLSPYARNLSMSLGAATTRPIADLGGLSLVVGLALADAIEEMGVSGLQLKWPNDILVNDEKLCGILVELVQRRSTVEIVIGIGVNISLTADEMSQIGQPVADLRRLGVTISRSELVVAFITRVQQYLQKFDADGFEPFIAAFNALHKYHDQICSIIQGDNETTGRVSGVGFQGELILFSGDSEQRFHGGEVSLRGPG